MSTESPPNCPRCGRPEVLAPVQPSSNVQTVLRACTSYVMGHGASFTEAIEAIESYGAAAEARGHQQAEQELKVTEQLLAERQKVLDAIPNCPDHGKCVPHAIEWISKMKLESEDMKQALAAERRAGYLEAIWYARLSWP